MSKDFYALPGKFSVSKKFMSEPISNPFVNGNNKVTVRGWCGSRSPKRKKRNSSNHPPAIDLVKFSKNEFFEKHKCLMMTIAKMSMRSIQKKFIFLNPEDLLSYAYEGMILALSKVTDMYHVKIGYMYIHACKACLHGALSMTGIRRRQKKYNLLSTGEEVPVFKSIQPFRPEQMIELQDSQYMNSCLHSESENKLVNRLDAKIFYYRLKNKRLKRIFLLLMHGKSSHYICKKVNISKRSYYYHLKKLNQIAACFASERSMLTKETSLPAIDMRKVLESCENDLLRKLIASAASYKKPKLSAHEQRKIGIKHRISRPKRLLKDRKRFWEWISQHCRFFAHARRRIRLSPGARLPWVPVCT